MKIVITGHKTGLGEYVSDAMIAQGHTVTGYSRSTGYDINDADVRDTILLENLDADLFFNNAYGRMQVDFDDMPNHWKRGENGQLKLLEQFCNAWKGRTDKYILHSGSKIVYKNIQKIKQVKTYRIDKMDCTKLIKTYTDIGLGPNICDFSMGMFDTPMADVWPDYFIRGKVEDYGKTMVMFINNKEIIWPKEAVFDNPGRVEFGPVELAKREGWL
jgi:hypothetical protein